MKEIKIFRLVTTEQIIGFYIGETPETVLIEYPLEIIIEYSSEEDKHELSGIKWFPFSNDMACEIHKSSILSISHSPKEELVLYYKNKINKLYIDNVETDDSDESNYYQSVLDSFDDDTEH
jgi:hypothetical protein